MLFYYIFAESKANSQNLGLANVTVQVSCHQKLIYFTDASPSGQEMKKWKFAQRYLYIFSLISFGLLVLLKIW